MRSLAQIGCTQFDGRVFVYVRNLLTVRFELAPVVDSFAHERYEVAFACGLLVIGRLRRPNRLIAFDCIAFDRCVRASRSRAHCRRL